MDEKYTKLNNIRLDGKMSEEDEVIFGNAKSLFQTKVIEELYEKYTSLDIVKQKKKYSVNPRDNINVDFDGGYKEAKDVLLFNKVRKTLKHELLKEDVLEAHKNTCSECKHQFPTRKQFKKDHPRTIYPLFVRCLFNIPCYLNKKRILTINEAMKDEAIFNKDNYQPICTDCKPSRFAKRKL